MIIAIVTFVWLAIGFFMAAFIMESCDDNESREACLVCIVLGPLSFFAWLGELIGKKKYAPHKIPNKSLEHDQGALGGDNHNTQVVTGQEK